MTELRITTDLDALPRELTFNFDELKTELTEKLQRYQGLIVTEDTIKEGKEDRAKLNKLKTAIDTRRKEIKKQWNEPYNVFESRIKEIIALVDAPIQAIDNQLNTYEEQRKVAKENEIYDLYHETVPQDVKGILLFDRIFDQRWLNKSVSLSEIKKTMEELATRVQNDVAALKEIDPEHAVAVRAEYYRSLDLGAAMRLLSELKETATAMKAEKPTENPPEAVKPTESAQEPQRAPEPTDTVYLLRLEMQLTMQQANELKQYLIDNHINFKKI